MPLNAFAQLERELGVPLVPRPLTREIGHDRIQTSLRFLLIIHYQIVEYANGGTLARDRQFLVDGHASRAVEEVDLENPALLLRDRRIGRGGRENQRGYDHQ
jgi:hypothetical protein